MATKIQDFVIQDCGGSKFHVWGNAPINHLRELEGVAWVDNMKSFGYYAVYCDARYNKDSVKDDIIALEKRLSNE